MLQFTVSQIINSVAMHAYLKMVLLLNFLDLGTLFAAMVLSDCQVEVYQMKDEWRYVRLVDGKQFVTTTGVRMKQEWCVDNLDMLPKVLELHSYTLYSCIVNTVTDC